MHSSDFFLFLLKKKKKSVWRAPSLTKNKNRIVAVRWAARFIRSIRSPSAASAWASVRTTRKKTANDGTSAQKHTNTKHFVLLLLLLILFYHRSGHALSSLLMPIILVLITRKIRILNSYFLCSSAPPSCYYYFYYYLLILEILAHVTHCVCVSVFYCCYSLCHWLSNGKQIK